MLEVLFNNRIECVAVILFAVGYVTLLVSPNMIKKIIGINIMDSACNLFLTSIGFVYNKTAPIIVNGDTSMNTYINPLPAGLVLTSIVVGVSVTAVMLALTYKMYEKYHTLNLNEVYKINHELEDKEKWVFV